jgi:hypothetical protein
MKLSILGLASAALLSSAAPALAHHSHAMFDFTKTLELNATVTKFEWTNPHSWLHVMAANEKGETVEYTIEMGAPAALVGRGWRPTLVVPGDKVIVNIYPTKDGSAGGTLRNIKLPDGKAFGTEF